MHVRAETLEVFCSADDARQGRESRGKERTLSVGTMAVEEMPQDSQRPKASVPAIDRSLLRDPFRGALTYRVELQELRSGGGSVLFSRILRRR